MYRHEIFIAAKKLFHTSLTNYKFRVAKRKRRNIVRFVLFSFCVYFHNLCCCSWFQDSGTGLETETQSFVNEKRVAKPILHKWDLRRLSEP
jgi:hypothetical protein